MRVELLTRDRQSDKHPPGTQFVTGALVECDGAFVVTLDGVYVFVQQGEYAPSAATLVEFFAIVEPGQELRFEEITPVRELDAAVAEVERLLRDGPGADEDVTDP